MTKLPDISTIQLFITNRRKWGWTDAYIASVLRQRLEWDALEPDEMDKCGREKYGELRELLVTLEQGAGYA